MSRPALPARARGGRRHESGAGARLILLDFRNGHPGLREGFEALGHEVREDAQSEPEGVRLCVADLTDCARRIRRTLALGRRLAARGAALLALDRDAPWHRGVHRARLAVLAWLAPFDACATHSMQQAGRFAVRTLYCPNAARESLYRVTEEELRAMRDPAFWLWDVSFVGNLDSRRYPEHARRVEFLRALEDRLKPAKLRVQFRDGAGLAAGEPVEIIKRTRINLSALAACDAGSEPSWGLPERCYGVPAAGGFLLCDRRRHAADDFAHDERAEYAGLDDCAARIAHFLAHPDEARGIAERAHARVMREHLYRHRAARLLDFATHAR
jgi:spore maturation protein CgeB